MRVPELLQQRAKLHDEAKALLDNVTKEGRSVVNSDEQVKLDKLEADMNGLTDIINRETRMAKFAGQLEQPIHDSGRQQIIPSTGADIRTAIAERQRREDAIAEWMRVGLTNVREEFRSLLPKTDERGIRDGIGVDLRVASPLSDVTGAAGAYTIPQGFYAVLTEAMKWYGGMRQSNATILRTATGNSMPMPTVNDSSNTGELVAENTAVTQASTEMSFGQVTLAAYKFSSKLVLVPFELLQDSAFDVGSFVAKLLGIRIGRITNTYFTTGTGSSQPQGIITGSTLGVTAASATAFTYAELVQLTHTIDPAYRAAAQWMFHDNAASYLERLLDANNRPLLVSSLTGISQPIRGGEATSPGKYYLLGYPVVINQDMASAITTGLKTLLFGDTSTYYIREVMDMQLVRFAEKYMDAGQVGFLAYYRADGHALDAGTHPLKYLIQL